MTPAPDFHDLVGTDLPADEEARLRRVHELLVVAGPPPELSPDLEQTPPRPRARVISLASRRRKAGLLLAAAVAAAAFGGGYLAGSSGGGSSSAFPAQRVVQLHGAQRATVVVRVGKRDGNGNVPMLVTTEGLPHQPGNGYYTLWMTMNGKRLVACGSFNVAGGTGQTTVRLVVGYRLDPFDGFALTKWQNVEHRNVPVAGATI
jgi:Anti-sigma-K factor rskA